MTNWNEKYENEKTITKQTAVKMQSGHINVWIAPTNQFYADGQLLAL